MNLALTTLCFQMIGKMKKKKAASKGKSYTHKMQANNVDSSSYEKVRQGQEVTVGLEDFFTSYI